MKYILYIIPLLHILGCYSKQPEKTSHQGESLPEFSLLLPDSITNFNTNKLSHNKSVILFYFGPRCPYSHAQMNLIIDELGKFDNTELIIFTTAPFNQMKWFCKKYELNKYTNIVTGVDYNNFFGRYFNAFSVPYLAIYGKDHKLKSAFSGQTPVDQIISLINE